MKIYFAIENGKSTRVECETRTEAERFFGYGNVFDSNIECLNAIRTRQMPKRRVLSDTEIKALLKEQLEYGRSLMSEIDWAIRKESLKTIEQKQREFAREMMKGE